MVRTVRAKLPTGGIGQLPGEDPVEPPAAGWVEDGGYNFHPAAEVSGPPIGGAVEIFVRTAVPEVIDPGVLEEPSHDAPDAIALRESRCAGLHGADAAHDEIDFHPGL
jgi:hypothetical protein